MITINTDGKFEEDQNIKLVDEMVSDNYNHRNRREPREKDRPGGGGGERPPFCVRCRGPDSGSQARLICGN